MPESAKGTGYLESIKASVNATEAASLGRGRGKDLQSRKVDETTHQRLQGENFENIRTVADMAPDAFQEKEHRVVVADISDIVDRYARTVGEARAKEHLETKVKWWNRWFVRQSEAGYIEKYYREAKEEILKNRNLLSDIQTRWMKKSQGKALNVGDETANFEILDEVIESLWQERLRKAEAEENVEGAEHIRDTAMDAKAAELIADFICGKITSRKDFEKRAETEIFKDIAKNNGQKEGEMYASNLFSVAESYQKHFEEKLGRLASEFGTEQKEIVREYLKRTMKLDVMLAKKQADIAREKPKGVMKWLENTVNFTQNPFFKSPPKTWLGKALHKAGSLTIGNPILYAYLGNRLGYGTAVATGGFAAKAVGLSAAAAFGIGPGLVMAAGAGLGAGVYLGIRAAVERLRDVRRRQEEAVLGKRGDETHSLWNGREAAAFLQELSGKNTLDDADKLHAAAIMATLRLQDTLGKNLISVSKEEGARYGSNFMAVQDLRRAINEFWQKQAKLFGENPAEQRRVLENLLSMAEGKITEEIAKKDKETAREIRRRGLAVGAMGAAATMTAACLAPGAGKLLKKGANSVFEFFGGNPKFDTSKVTFTEEIWHKIQEKFGHKHFAAYDDKFYTSAFASRDGAVKQFIDYPYDGTSQYFKQELVVDNGHNFLQIKGLKPEPFDIKIPLDQNGVISDETAAFAELRKHGWEVDKVWQKMPKGGVKSILGAVESSALPASKETGDGFSSWLESIRSGKTPGVQVETVHTKGFYDNLSAEEYYDGTKHIHRLNELKFHLTQMENGDIQVDSHGLTKGGSYMLVDGEDVGPDILELKAQGKLKFVFIPDSSHPNEAILFDMDESGNAIIPKGSKGYDLFDPRTGRPRQGVVFGTAQVEDAGQGGGKNLYWLNSEKSAVGEEMVFGKGSGELQRVGATKGGLLADALGSGETAEEVVGFRIRPPLVHNFEDFAFVPTGWKRQKDAKLDKLRKKAKGAGANGLVHGEAAGHGTTAAGEHHGGGGAARETAANSSATSTVQAAQRESGRVAETHETTTTTAISEAEAHTSAEKKRDAKLVKYIIDYNNGDLNEYPNKNPHITLQFEDRLLVPPQAVKTKMFIKRLLNALKEPTNNFHHTDHKAKNFLLKFQSAESDPVTKADGTKVLTFNPDEQQVSMILPVLTRQLSERQADRAGARADANAQPQRAEGGASRGAARNA